ncbi:MAG: DUF484 family protein [Sulfuriferula sp.]|nr:DUF484 family protein [Sulfuriferula sp.]
MKSDEIARYLATHPEFFDEYPHLLTDIRVSHPFEGRAIPIAERQILNLRDKVTLLETKLAELIQFGEENDISSQKMQHIAVAMMAARDLPTLIHALYLNLREDFAIPHATLRIWQATGDEVEFTPCSDEVKTWVENMPHPQCGAYLHPEALTWLGDASHLRSYAAIPLKNDQLVGVLILASEDTQRFYPQMGTLYLQRLGELIAAGLQRLLP